MGVELKDPSRVRGELLSLLERGLGAGEHIPPAIT